MIDVNNLRKGVTFEHDGNIWKVLEYSHNKPGRGKATIRVKTRNLRTGANLEMTFNSGDRVQDIRLDHHNVQFLYTDGEFYHFMDLETYEQPALNADVLGEATQFLKENLEVKLTFFDGKAIDIDLP
ncbi:MAG TPA: elongation factor P, partial [Chloroflexi bacterium]|nr:elongation factor P [Chloroflexota bacterium]